MGSSTDERFNWNSDETTVLRTRMGVAVYFNPADDVVVRQEGEYGDEDDWIIMTPEDACRVAYRILEMVEEVDPVAAAEGGKKDRTAAERQRRHRDKVRGVTPPVTANDRDGHAVTPVLGVAAE